MSTSKIPSSPRPTRSITSIRNSPFHGSQALTTVPTSARFAIVDYDGGTEVLNPPARWDGDLGKFVDSKGKVLDRDNLDSPQFRQMNVWATLQNALDFFESGFGLGRRIAWGFEGNRLIVVPHAGYGENAFYDRDSKSLQFYYFDRGEEGLRKRIHTCLSADIINHEFGHAVLDGIRPHYHELVLRRDRGIPRVPWRYLGYPDRLP